MVKDLQNGNIYRADKYLEDWIDIQIENKKTSADLKQELAKVKVHVGELKKEELSETFKKYKVLSKDNNELGEPEEFNLMFATQIGPTGAIPAFLRPETA